MYFNFILILLISPATFSFPEEFFAPVYELGAPIPPLSSNGEVKPGKPSQFIPEIGLDTRIDEENSQDYKPPVPPSFVLGSNPPISSIQPWKPSQIIPPDHPETISSSNNVDKTTKKPSGAGFEVNNVQQQSVNKDKTTPSSISLEYKPSRPSFHPNPGNNIAQIIPSDASGSFSSTSKIDIVDRIQSGDGVDDDEEDNDDGDDNKKGNYYGYDVNKWGLYADKYNNYVVNYVTQKPQKIENTKKTQKPIVLEYKPTRPFYAGSPKN